MANSHTNPWFQVPRPAPGAALRLFCFPYAGGSAAIYDGWGAALFGDVEVVAVQYPGRGNRFHEPLIDRCSDMVAALLPQIRPLLAKPFAFFGHSNGGLISYELARALQREGVSQQVHHFVSGHRAIHLPQTDHAKHQLPDDEFIRELVDLGGTPQELLESRELLDLFLPVLRADFALSETYTFPGGAPLRSSMSLLYGSDDIAVPESDVLRWIELVDGRIDYRCFNGGHFFVQSHKQQVIDFVSDRLGRLLGRLARTQSPIQEMGYVQGMP